MDLKLPVSSELQNSNISFWNIEVSECQTKTLMKQPKSQKLVYD